MILKRELSVRLLEFFLAGASRNAQHFVIISLADQISLPRMEKFLSLYNEKAPLLNAS
jgi:hypothetical protein